MRRIAALMSIFLFGIALTGVLSVLARDRAPSSASIQDSESRAEHRLVQGTPCVATDVEFILLADPPLDEEADRELLEAARNVIESRANRHGRPLSPIYLPDNGRYVVVELSVFGGESELPQVRRILTTGGHVEIIDPLEAALQVGETVTTSDDDPAESQVAGTPPSTPTRFLGPFPTLIDDRDLNSLFVSEIDGDHFVIVQVTPNGASRLAEYMSQGVPPPVIVQDNTVLDPNPDVAEDRTSLAIRMPSRDAAEALSTYLVSGPLPLTMQISWEEQLAC